MAILEREGKIIKKYRRKFDQSPDAHNIMRQYCVQKNQPVDLAFEIIDEN